MPTALKLLLRASLLRGEQESENRRARRPPRLRHKDSASLARKVEEPHAGLRASAKLYPYHLPSPFGPQVKTSYAPGLWTRYGRWDSEGKRVFNQRGKVIYELP